jgi:hypothetical protein
MSDAIIFVKFQNTLYENTVSSQQRAIGDIVEQLKAAVKRIENDSTAIYDYVRMEVYVPPGKSPVETIPTSIAIIPTSGSIPANPQSTENDIVESVFKSLKKTDKSLRIIKYFAQNSGLELNVDQISSGASISKSDLSVWFATTGKNVKAIC